MAHNNDKTLSIIEQVFKTMPQLLDERQRCLLAASVVKGYGHGGINKDYIRQEIIRPEVNLFTLPRMDWNMLRHC